MNISDFVPGTAWIRIYRSHYKYESDFEKLCEFLKLPTTCKVIDLQVKEGYCRGY